MSSETYTHFEDKKETIANQNKFNDDEEKFRSKLTGLEGKSIGSMLLLKRLNRARKYFDSGDYNIAKQKKHEKLPPQVEEAILHESTGETIATPASVPAVRKKSTHPPPVDTTTQPVPVAASLKDSPPKPLQEPISPKMSVTSNQ